jgi:arylsulfatase A-like enzyme
MRSSHRDPLRPNRWSLMGVSTWFTILLAPGCATVTAEPTDTVSEEVKAGRDHDHDHDHDHDGAQRPNILMILADDLGYSDIGAFGGEIKTPNLDALAAQGLILTNHHAAAACSPTRAALFSGTDPHLAGIGTMAEALPLNPVLAGKPGYEGFLRPDALSIAQLLLDAGYHTYLAGKWHLGGAAAQLPPARGFESSWGPIGGFEGHFAPVPGLPTPIDSATVYRENGVATAPPANYFSSDFYTDKLIEYIQANIGDEKPFFAYAAYTAPHWPLMAPEEYIDRYAGVYDVGYSVIRNQRIERMKRMGILPRDFEPNPGLPVTGNTPGWDELTAEQKLLEARRMEVYAAMVENLDHNIGRLIDYLKQVDKYDNTFIFFQSDNGAEAATTYRPENTTNVDNSFTNIGRPRSNWATGRRWAEVSATPFSLSKGHQAEGGISVPAIAKMPSEKRGRGRSQRPIRTITRVMDLAPTFLELAQVANPGSTYGGQSVKPITGKSMLGALDHGRGHHEHGDRVHDRDEVLAGELFGRRFVQRRNWKALWTEPPWGPGQWALYDIEKDRGETTDLALSRPDVVAELEAQWQSYVAEVGIVIPAVVGWPVREGIP